jgi:transposase-like protein
LKIVLSVLQGESTQAEAARRHGVSETSIGKWKEQFLSAGRQGLEQEVRAGKPTGQETRMGEEIDDLTRALGEAHAAPSSHTSARGDAPRRPTASSSAPTGRSRSKSSGADLPADGTEMTLRVEAFHHLYTTIRPHQTLAGVHAAEP